MSYIIDPVFGEIYTGILNVMFGLIFGIGGLYLLKAIWATRRRS